MKKFLLPTVLVCFGFILNAQNVYFTLSPGYGIGLPGNKLNFGEFGYFLDEFKLKQFEYENHKRKNFGSGIQFGGSLIIDLSKRFEAELGVNFLTKSKRISTYNGKITSYNGYTGMISSSDEYIGSVTSIVTNLIYKIPKNHDRGNFYLKGGLLINSCKLRRDAETRIELVQPGYSYVFNGNLMNKFEFSKSSSLGFTIGLGNEIKLSNGIKSSFFFYEMGYNHISYRPKKAEYISLVLDNIEYKSRIASYLREYEFTDEVDEATFVAEDEPMKYPVDSYPFSNLYLKFGIKVEL